MKVTSFEVNNDLFIAFANSFVRSAKTKTKVYVLQQNKFTPNQTLYAEGTRGFEYFTIHGDHFLTVIKQYKQNSHADVYRWQAGKFKVFQRLKINGLRATHYFTISTRKCVSFSGIGQVSIYEWKNKIFSNKIQDIHITYPYRCNTFNIHNITYIACGRGVGAHAVTVLKWSGKQFEPFQGLPSSYVKGSPHSFRAKGTVYLVIANFQSSRNNPATDSFIYRWNGTKFVHHQSIPTHGAMGWDSFSTAAGEVFLVVANYNTRSGARLNVKSVAYKMADNKFNLYQQLQTTGAENVHAFTHKGKQYLAVVNYYDGISYDLDSAMYIWN